MANGVPPTIADIINAGQAAIDAIDAQIQTTSALQKGGPDDPALAALKRLQAQKSDIFDQMSKSILQSPQLAAALAVMQAATKQMNDTAQNMKTITGVVGNLGKFLGYANQVETALGSVTSGTGGGGPKASG